MIEIWRNIIGYEGLYQVSNWGRVKSLNYNHTGQERVLKPKKTRKGYLYVNLCKDGKVKTHQIHRLVGMAFPDMVSWDEDAKGRPFEELTINHLNEDKSVNLVSNLQWITLEGNLKYGTRNERIAKALTNGKTAKRVAQKTKDGELIKIWPSTHEIERQTGYDQGYISKCCLNYYGYKSAYGSCWEYVEQ